jgi:hypothetical protein
MEKEITLTIPYDSGFTHVLFNIAAQGFEFIKISYSGSGDSGAIDEVELIPTGFMSIKDNRVEWNKNNKEAEYGEPTEELKSIIEERAYKYVLNSADDWYNNEGGGGTLYISTMDGQFHCDHYTYEQITHDSVLTGKFGDN